MSYSKRKVLKELGTLLPPGPSHEECVTPERALAVARSLGIDLDKAPFTAEEFRLGVEVEHEHCHLTHLTDVVGEDPCVAGMLALNNLRLRPDYYTQLTTVRSPGDPGFPGFACEGLGCD